VQKKEDVEEEQGHHIVELMVYLLFKTLIFYVSCNLDNSSIETIDIEIIDNCLRK